MKVKKILIFVLAVLFLSANFALADDKERVPKKRLVVSPKILKKQTKVTIPKSLCCRFAQQEMMKFLNAMTKGLQMKEAGNVLGYKLTKKGCEVVKMSYYVGFDFGPDGCLGISTDKKEALEYLKKVKNVEQLIAPKYGVTVVTCGIGKPSPGDAKYFKFCNVNPVIPSTNWVIKCMVEKGCK